jgi:TolB-like protein
MRVNVQLIDAETGGRRWAERFGGLRVERPGREK